MTFEVGKNDENKIPYTPHWTYWLQILHCNPIQGSTGFCREIPSMKTGFPVMKTGLSLWELTYREFPVSLTGFGFAVYQSYAFKGCISLKTLKSWLLSTDKNTFFNSHTYKVDIGQHFHLSLKSAVLVESVFKSRVDYNRARRYGIYLHT